MQESSDIDFEFLFRLSSLYQALTLSAVDSVVLPTGIEDERFSEIFYDCYDNEEEALRMMRRRIEVAEQDIRQHFQMHDSFLSSFYTIDEGINAISRKRIGEASVEICKNVLSYNNLVHLHNKKLGREAFLKYLRCIRGHYFYIRGDSRVAELSFNPKKSYEGIIEEVKDIEELIVDFGVKNDRIPAVKVSSEDSGEGIIDTSLRGRLELGKELLDRLGMKIK